ncbi:MAG: glycosyltransferase family 39 protein [Chloroflexi bacterium]|nr:glycosyltransferase family 39 protein [Chloroflexota bacterium]
MGVAIFLRVYNIDSVPPGLYHDEAVNGLDVLDVLRGQFSIFFERNNGREPLFIYFQAISVYFLGNSALALRLASAVVGVLTVLATFLLAREWFGYRVGLLSMAGIAIAFWHVDLSRVGLRAISTPLFLELSLLFLWRALKGGRLATFVLAGGFSGLTFYTYSSARLAVLLFASILLAELATNYKNIRGHWRGVALFVLATVLVTMPLVIYFAAHPDYFSERVQQVSIFNERPAIESEPMTFQQSLQGAAEMFFIAGDRNWRHNIQGRPVFDPLSGAFFVTGLVWALVANVRRSQRLLTIETLPVVGRSFGGIGSAPARWLMLWFFVMLLPDVLSHESPNFLRLTGLAPAIFIIAALGYALAWQSGAHAGAARLGRLGNAFFALFLAALFSLEGFTTFQDYFGRWAKLPQVYWLSMPISSRPPSSSTRSTVDSRRTLRSSSM